MGRGSLGTVSTETTRLIWTSGLVIETSLPRFDVMNRDQSPVLKATCMVDGDTACHTSLLVLVFSMWSGGAFQVKVYECVCVTVT